MKKKLEKKIDTFLQQRAVLEREEDLEVTLTPARPLLVAVPHGVGRLADRQVLLHVAAVPPGALELHAQGKVFRQSPGRETADLDEGAGPDEEVGPRAGDEAEGVVAGLQVSACFFRSGGGGWGVELERKRERGEVEVERKKKKKNGKKNRAHSQKCTLEWLKMSACGLRLWKH